jgi:hypothetical protein
MIVPDVNLLLYAEIDAHRLHARARRWWEDALSGERQVGPSAGRTLPNAPAQPTSRPTGSIRLAPIQPPAGCFARRSMLPQARSRLPS